MSGERDSGRGQSTPTGGGEDRPASERRIGAYRILRELGHGGGGTVYLAARADEQFQKRVALKIIPAGADSADVVRHFKRERQILAALSHPNIARLLDGGTTDDGLPYFVMEHVEGEPLLAWCDARGLGISERLKLFQSICSAVQYAHRNLVVHRDIKPGNILVASDGSPRLLDFGIAKLLNPEVAGEVPTATRMVMTPEYASPEQVRGERITTATDIYSLGVVLYELLTGQRPYSLPTRNPLDVMRAVVDQEPLKPSAAVERMRIRAVMAPEEESDARVAEAVSRSREGTLGRLQRKLRGDLDNIVMTAMRKEPQRRYASVEALTEDIRRHREGRPVSARKGTVAYRASKFVRRHRVSVAAAAAGLFLLAGFPVAMAVQSSRVAQERDLAQKERAAAQRERETAQRVSGFLVDLFKVSDPSEARGNTVTAREVLDRGAAKIATELQDQAEVRGTLMNTMGMVYRNLGLYDRALPLLQQALETRKGSFGGEHVEVAKSLNNLALVLWEKGDYAGAEALYREALAMRRRLLGNEHSEVAKNLNNIAIILEARGDYAGAEALLRETLALKRKLQGNEHPDVATSLNNLGNVLFERGDYAGAEAIHREALGMWRRLRGNEHPEVARSLSNLANVLNDKRDYTGAEALHREAVAMGRRLYGNQNPRLAISLVSFAETLCREGKAAEGEPLAREALGIFGHALPGGHPFIAATESVLGECLTLSRRYAEAEPLLLRSYPLLDAKAGRHSPETRKARQRLADLYEAWGKPGKAVEYRADIGAGSHGQR